VSFREIEGQDAAIEFLKRSIAGDTVSHAYIFMGPPGVGKKLTAINFAKALNCLDPKDGGPCDLCSRCKKINGANHPDVFLIAPEKEDSSFGIDKIRGIIKDIGLKPYEGRRKVYILEGAGAMTPEAQNSILKTLEEPPSDAVIILIAENLNHILTTIQSRARKVAFFPLGASVVEKILVDSHGVDRERAGILSRISSGLLGKALKYKDEGFFEKRLRIIDGLRNESFFDSDFDGVSKSDLKLCLDVMLTWYRDILVVKAQNESSNGPALVNVDRQDAILAESRRLGFDRLNKIIEQIVLTGSFLEQNANPKLAMSVLGIDL